MKTGTKKFLATLVTVIIIIGWAVAIKGAGPIKSINKQLKYGLDINGGVYVLLQADTNAKGSDLTKLMDQTKSVLENRVNAMGISEATVSVEGTNKVRVEMPGVDDADTAIKQIGKTAQLRFLLADGTQIMSGNDIKDASFSTDSSNGGYKITIDFTSAGSQKFAKATEKTSQGTVTSTLKNSDGSSFDAQSIIIMLDNKVISAPRAKNVINNRSCEITRQGGFSKEEASQTSSLIRGGALPATLTEVNSSVETATIGANALVKSVKAGIIGLAIVFLLMLVTYGLLGFIADLALSLYVLIVLVIMVALGAVLTLPGIAGIILSIGMAVDSNVIIFTRIREEIAKGKSIRASVDTGFKSALSTVVDSQTTTLIASIVLYLIGTTAVKGFALTLMLGTICSIFTAVIITQLYVTLLADSKKFGQNKYFGVNEDGSPKFKLKHQFDFIGNRKKFYALSLCVIIIGVVCAGFKGFNYGIDFTGGTTIQLDMGKKVNIEEVKETIAKHKLNPQIVYAGEKNNQIVIRTIKALKADQRQEVINTIDSKYKLKKDAVLSSEEFGPTVGKELRRNAVKSILIATFCMLIYIRFRFKNWNYGLAAVGGLGHDVLVTLAIYAIFGFTINNPFIAGILTVVGYSINDTIVVFDRIRENTKFYKRKEVVSLINDSINQTLSRSIMTSITTIVVMIPLFMLVSSEIRQFLIPLIIGVLVGTYSSIFLCSPLLYESMRRQSMSKYAKQIEQNEKQRKRIERAKRENDGIIK
ncbi:protein translocase subunit SecD [Mogibacterium pumilum]|uniref:Multifunctional fusion protein n=1 Tax=Mogibacterium pumilum TaxID=86332 RepID=A0A223AT06_9FIRM|nr:protein translocase subunit SecD [Mogibacterium pumilum]ASS38035.1 hypothetical protein AXF17_06080 [Mogibacterium pumilum]